MNPAQPSEFRISLSPTPDGLTVLLEGYIDTASAWDVIKRLETCEREAYPVTLDLNGVAEVHWLAAQVLTAGLKYIVKAKGPVRLVLPGRAVEDFHHWMLRPDFWKVGKVSPEASRRSGAGS